MLLLQRLNDIRLRENRQNVRGRDASKEGAVHRVGLRHTEDDLGQVGSVVAVDGINVEADVGPVAQG